MIEDKIEVSEEGMELLGDYRSAVEEMGRAGSSRQFEPARDALLSYIGKLEAVVNAARVSPRMTVEHLRLVREAHNDAIADADGVSLEWEDIESVVAFLSSGDTRLVSTKEVEQALDFAERSFTDHGALRCAIDMLRGWLSTPEKKP